MDAEGHPRLKFAPPRSWQGGADGRKYMARRTYQDKTPLASAAPSVQSEPHSCPVGPSAGSVARWTLASAPCSGVRNPLWPLRSVAQYPGFAALTLIGVSNNSFAYIAVTMFSAVFDTGYGNDVRFHSGLFGLMVAEIEPTSVETLTIRAAGAFRRSGSIALVTVMTPRTFVSRTVRIVANVVMLGSPTPSARRMPALLIRMSRCPNSASIAAAAARTWASSVTSSGM